MKKLSLAVTAIVIVLVVWCSRGVFAFELFNGRLHEGRGNFTQCWNLRTHQDDRDIYTSSARTTFRIEGLLDITAPGCTPKLQAYGLFQYWHDWAPDADLNLRDSILHETGGSHKLHDYQYCRTDFREMVKELYLDFNWGPWNIRPGLQMVSWGETAETRVADLINPLDTKNLVAFPDWEDYKIGLWMLRVFYNPYHTWQDISYEFILIPYFEPNILTPAGSAPSGSPIPGYVRTRYGTIYWPEYTSDVMHHMQHDTPKKGNVEVGLRIRGQTHDVDWTVSTFYTRLDSPIINGAEGVTNLMNMMNKKAIKKLGLAYPIPPTGKIYTYPHYLSTAITYSTPIFWKQVLRGEACLNSNREYNYGRTNQVVTRDLFTHALTLNRYNMVPWFSYWNRARSVTSAFTWTYYKLFGFKHNEKTREYIVWENGRNRDSSFQTFSLALSTDFLYAWIAPSFTISYNTNRSTTLVGAIRSKPGDRWWYQVAYQQINELKSGNLDVGRYSDQVILTIGYEFD
jgi:hypothetical protein